MTCSFERRQVSLFGQREFSQMRAGSPSAGIDGEGIDATATGVLRHNAIFRMESALQRDWLLCCQREGKRS